MYHARCICFDAFLKKNNFNYEKSIVRTFDRKSYQLFLLHKNSIYFLNGSIVIDINITVDFDMCEILKKLGELQSFLEESESRKNKN